MFDVFKILFHIFFSSLNSYFPNIGFILYELSVFIYSKRFDGNLNLESESLRFLWRHHICQCHLLIWHSVRKLLGIFWFFPVVYHSSLLIFSKCEFWTKLMYLLVFSDHTIFHNTFLRNFFSFTNEHGL